MGDYRGEKGRDERRVEQAEMGLMVAKKDLNVT